MEEKQLTLYVITLVSLCITTATVATRCVVRFAIKGFSTDDWLMIIGQAFYVATCIVALIGTKSGIGVVDELLTIQQRVHSRHSILNTECLYLTSLLFVKASICFALLRINTRKAIRYYLYGVLFFSVCQGFITIVGLLSLCKPVSASWTGKGKCADPSVLRGLVIFVTVDSIFTDISFAVVPYFILWNIKMKKSLKIYLCGILSLGSLASVASIVRASYLSRFTATTNYAWGYADLIIWSIVEVLIAITIGSVPSLKPLFKKMSMLEFPTSYPSGQSGSRSGNRADYGFGSSRKGYALNSIDAQGTSRTDCQATRGDESESVKNILREEVVLVSSDYSMHVEQGPESVYDWPVLLFALYRLDYSLDTLSVANDFCIKVDTHFEKDSANNDAPPPTTVDGVDPYDVCRRASDNHPGRRGRDIDERSGSEFGSSYHSLKDTRIPLPFSRTPSRYTRD